MEGGLLLNVVVRESSAVLELLTGEDKSLLVGGDALLVLDLGLDVLDGVRGLHLQGDGLACEGRQGGRGEGQRSDRTCTPGGMGAC